MWGKVCVCGTACSNVTAQQVGSKGGRVEVTSTWQHSSPGQRAT